MINKNTRKIFTGSVEYCIKEKGILSNVWIIMTNDIHLIMSAKIGFAIGEILLDLKRFTSKQLFKLLKKTEKKGEENARPAAANQTEICYDLPMETFIKGRCLLKYYYRKPSLPAK